MTYILGAKCKDGVVLVGDRKLTTLDGSLVGYVDKIFHLPPIVVGGSGVSGLFEKFQTKVTHYVQANFAPNQPIPVDPFIEAIERIVGGLNFTYGDSVGRVAVLVGMQTSHGSLLQYILPSSPMGMAETVREYKSIGHGIPYASLLLNMLWRRDLTMQDVANIGYFIVKSFEKYPQMDNTVGVDDERPQVWFIPNDNVNQAIVERKDLDTLDSTTARKLDLCKAKLEEIFGLLPPA
jgi:20S proteasome alpha/beta subunit